MSPYETAWMIQARKLIGVREIAGQKHNPVIIGWLKALKSWVTDDETAWCGTFMAHIMSQYGYRLPKNWLGARNWMEFGHPTTAGYGAVLVFWRGKKSGWQGHVGLYVGEDATHYHVLGGNQNDSVSISRMPKARLLEARWPNAQVLDGFVPAVVKLNAKGAPVSTSEA